MTSYYILYEITFTPTDDESKHEPVSLKGEITVPDGAELEEDGTVGTSEEAEEWFYERLSDEDECDYVDCSKVPFFRDGFDTDTKIYGSGEVEED
jgi:hypothetical protein